MKIISCYLAAAAVIFVLQVIPITGIFLMFLLAPVWISVLTNIMLIHIGVIALSDKSYRRWLLLPGTVYGGWFAFQAVSYSVTYRAIAAREALNHVNETIPIDADLIFDAGDDFAVQARTYIDSGRVFAGDYEVQIVPAPRSDVRACEQLNGHVPGRRGVVSEYNAPILCAVLVPSRGPHPGVRISAVPGTERGPSVLRPISYTISIMDAAGNERLIGALRSGVITTFSPWPIFWAGCMLDDNAARWRCSLRPIQDLVYYGVSKAPFGMGGSAQEAQLLATVLGRPAAAIGIGGRKWIPRP